MPKVLVRFKQIWYDSQVYDFTIEELDVSHVGLLVYHEPASALANPEAFVKHRPDWAVVFKETPKREVVFVYSIEVLAKRWRCPRHRRNIAEWKFEDPRFDLDAEV